MNEYAEFKVEMNPEVSPFVLENLKEYAYKYEVSDVANHVLLDSKFMVWGGSSGEGAHHAFDGGLALHTKEVFLIAKSSLETLFINDVDMGELFLACLFHDYGKLWDYERINGKWVATDHKRNIHHISRSAIEWMIASNGNYDEPKRDRILHAILSHHGTREWGSPVAPKSRLAWLLHISDQMSARMNDCNTSDVIIKGKK